MRFGRIQSERWHEVKTTDGDFRIKVKRPTAGERFRETSFSLATTNSLEQAVDIEEMQARYRVAVTIVGWDGLLDEKEQPIPFSVDALDALCSAYPQIYNSIAFEATRAFRLGWDAEDEAKDGASAPGN